MATGAQYAVSLVIDAKNRSTAAVRAAAASIRGLREQANLTARTLGFPRVATEAKQFGAALHGLGSPLARFGGNVRFLAGNVALLGGGLAGLALNAGINSAIERGNALAALADRYGLSVERLQELRFGAVREGADEQALDDGLKDLQKNIGEAANETGAAVDLFKALNIELIGTDNKVRSTNDVFLDLADRLKQIEDPATRAAVAQALKGDNGAKLVNLLAKGRGAIEAYAAEARDLGVITAEQARLAAELADRQAALGRAFDGLGGSIMQSVAPVMLPFLDFMKNLVIANREVIASNIADVVGQIAGALQGVDWGGAIGGIGEFVRAVFETVQWVGGWRNAMIIAAAVMHADLVVGVLKAAWAFGKLGVQAGWAMLKFAWLGGAALVGGVWNFVTALRAGYGVFQALNLAMRANPIGLLVTAFQIGAALILAFWEPIADWFAGLDFFKPVREKIAAFLSSLPAMARSAVGITDEMIAAIRGDSEVAVKPSAGPSAALPPFTPGVPPSFTPGLPPSLAAAAGADAAPAIPAFAVPDGSAAGGSGGLLVIRFENAPAGMRVVERQGEPATLKIELDQGLSLAGAG